LLRERYLSVKTWENGWKGKVLPFFFPPWGGVRLSPLGMSVTKWPIVPALDDRWWVCSSRWNENWQQKPNSEKTCPSDTLSSTNLTWPDLSSNPGCPGEKPVTNRLSYGTAIKCCAAIMQRKTSEGKTTPVKSAVTADISLLSGEIPFSLWNYKPPIFHYHKMYNWNRCMLLDDIWLLMPLYEVSVEKDIILS
jgi:hypothetical protein